MPRKVGCRRRGATCVALSTKGERKQILHGVDVRHFDDPPCPIHAAEGAAEVPSFAEQLRRGGWNEDRTVGTPCPSLKALEPESSRFNLDDGAVIEFQKVVAQVVRAKGEVSRGVVQNPGRPLGLGQIPGGLRAEIRPLLRFVKASDVAWDFAGWSVQ